MRAAFLALLCASVVSHPALEHPAWALREENASSHELPIHIRLGPRKTFFGIKQRRGLFGGCDVPELSVSTPSIQPLRYTGRVSRVRPRTTAIMVGTAVSDHCLQPASAPEVSYTYRGTSWAPFPGVCSCYYQFTRSSWISDSATVTCRFALWRPVMLSRSLRCVGGLLSQKRREEEVFGSC